MRRQAISAESWSLTPAAATVLPAAEREKQLLFVHISSWSFSCHLPQREDAPRRHHHDDKMALWFHYMQTKSLLFTILEIVKFCYWLPRPRYLMLRSFVTLKLQNNTTGQQIKLIKCFVELHFSFWERNITF